MSEKLTLFDRFGGTRKMAERLDLAPSTVQSWKSEGHIPAKHQPMVLDKAREHGIEISAEDIIFPLGREADEASDISASEGEADSHRPFCPTSSGLSPLHGATDASPRPPSTSLRAGSSTGQDWPLPAKVA